MISSFAKQVKPTPHWLTPGLVLTIALVLATLDTGLTQSLTYRTYDKA